MAGSGRARELAVEHATTAAARTGEDQLTDAIGQGLAAVAFALLEVASALRDVGRTL